jgi:hypothetical protein
MEHKIQLQKGDLPKKLPKNSEIQEVRFGIGSKKHKTIQKKHQ